MPKVGESRVVQVKGQNITQYWSGNAWSTTKKTASSSSSSKSVATPAPAPATTYKTGDVVGGVAVGTVKPNTGGGGNVMWDGKSWSATTSSPPPTTPATSSPAKAPSQPYVTYSTSGAMSPKPAAPTYSVQAASPVSMATPPAQKTAQTLSISGTPTQTGGAFDVGIPVLGGAAQPGTIAYAAQQATAPKPVTTVQQAAEAYKAQQTAPTSTYLNASTLPTGTSYTTQAVGTPTISQTPVQMANNADPMKVTAQQAAAGGGVMAPPQVLTELPSNKVISEGTGMGSPIQGQIGAIGSGITANAATGGGGVPVVTPPQTLGSPAASAPAPAAQGAPQVIQATAAQKASIGQTLGGGVGAMGPKTAAPAFANPFADLGPYDDAYQKRLAGQAVDNAEEQYRLMAERIGASSAQRGLMQGGASGINESLMRDLAMQTAGARTRGLNDAMLKTADQRASYGLQRAQGLMSAQRDEFDRWKTQELMPLEMQQTQATIDNLVAQGRIQNTQAESAKWVLENQGWLAFLEFMSKLTPAAGLMLGMK